MVSCWHPRSRRGRVVTFQDLTPVRPPEKFDDLWARPSGLRGKKMIGGGQYTTAGGDKAVISRFLAKHPRFTESYPYDGMVIPPSGILVPSNGGA